MGEVYVPEVDGVDVCEIDGYVGSCSGPLNVVLVLFDGCNVCLSAYTRVGGNSTYS